MLTETPIVIDWTYNEGAQTAKLKPQGIDWKVVVPSDAPPVAAYYNDAINKDASHPAAARCWLEYVFSPEGQNTWLKGFAAPVLLPGQIVRLTDLQGSETFPSLSPDGTFFV